jgi:hypothetical protein
MKLYYPIKRSKSMESTKIKFTTYSNKSRYSKNLRGIGKGRGRSIGRG